jgi:DNA-binding LacI/PurR family transcriptional regulator
VALEEAGLRVPEDVSVVGTDDIEFSSLARPSLTTIRIPRGQLGKLAFEVLDKMLHSSRRLGREQVLDTELVVRQSTSSAPIRAGEKTITSSTE